MVGPTKNSQSWTVAFGLMLLCNLIANGMDLHWLHVVSKCLLMPILAAQLWIAKPHSGEQAWRLVMVALGASWLGDIFLLKGNTPGFFIAGLLSFLTAHVLYILYFSKYKPPLSETWFWKHPFISFLVVAYSVLFYAYLIDRLGSMKIPVAIYCLVITIMLLQALASQKNITRPVYLCFTVGAGLFVVSDSILAFNKFYAPVPGAGGWIMASYGLAQWLITRGTILNREPVQAQN